MLIIGTLCETTHFFGKCLEYFRMTTQDDSGIDGFTSLTYIYIQKLCRGTPLNPDNLGPDSKKRHERYQGNC